MATSGIVPIIDFAPYLTGSKEEKAKVAQELFEACTKVGFLMLRNFDSIIPKSQVQRTFTATKQFFDLPVEEKDKLEWECPESNRGYVRQGRERVTQATSKEEIEKLRASAPDYKETMEIGKDYREGDFDSKFENRWPQEAFPEFKEISNDFFEKCHLLHLEIMRALALAMGLGEDYFDKKVDQKSHNLRLYVFRLHCSERSKLTASIVDSTTLPSNERRLRVEAIEPVVTRSKFRYLLPLLSSLSLTRSLPLLATEQ